jgi:hypothetical protein
MNQNVLDGVVAIEAKAAKIVEEAKARARQARDQVRSDLQALTRQLDDEAKQQKADYAQSVDAKKARALAQLDQQLQAARDALETVARERVGTLAEEVARLLEQRADGN